MAHNIDMTNGRANMAFIGDRKDIWHRLGEQMQAGMTTAQWAKAAGLDWQAILVNAYADLSGPEFAHLAHHDATRHSLVDGQRHIVRSDNGAPLGYCTDGYHPVQPRDVLNYFEQYISVDPRFHLDVAGSLRGGKIIWATATFNGGETVGGDKHVARLLMTTTFDLTGSTINKGTMTRVVCNNTLDAALADGGKSIVRTRHNTKFDARRVGAELAAIAQSFEQYKAMGDAMAKTHLTQTDISDFFKACLDIPFDAKKDEISTRKFNQFTELRTAYARTVGEGTAPLTAWSALNAVTRWTDHDRSSRGAGAGETENRFHSAQFGSGAQLKAKAVALLSGAAAKGTYTMEQENDKDLLAAISKKAFIPSSLRA